jgi:hypothetical protein
MKKLLLLILVLPFFIQLINSHAHHNIISKTVGNVADIEVISINRNQHEEPSLDELHKAITFSPSGLTCYFKHIYNCSKYAQEALPALPFKHLEEFLLHGNATNQPRSYTKAVFRLFDKKFKSIPFISAEELVPFLKKLPDLLEKELETDKNKKFFISRLIRFELENHFEDLKQNPDDFLDNLAEKIIESDFDIDSDINRCQLQFTITKFIDTCLNKAIWSPTDKDIWKNFMDIGKELTHLKDKNVIRDTDDLDDCQWTLTTRFCFFLSLSGSALSIDFYNQACEEISKGISHLDSLAEQEELIQSKTNRLKDSVIQNYAVLEGHNRSYYQDQLN